MLDVDNGIFFRNSTVAQLADDIVEENIGVAHALGLNLERTDIMQQVLKISKSSTGQLISTLQDLNSGNRTEIDYLNLEIARVAESLTPKIEVKRTRLLGELIQLKSFLSSIQDESELI